MRTLPRRPDLRNALRKVELFDKKQSCHSCSSSVLVEVGVCLDTSFFLAYEDGVVIGDDVSLLPPP